VSYRRLFHAVLIRLDAERAHALAARTLGALTRVPGARLALRGLLVPRDPCLRVHALGMDMPTPLGVAAGVDKDASWFEGLGALGFGCVEVGTVTARAQPGNPRPRIRRLPAARALANSMGFPNPGAATVAERLAWRRRDGPGVGVNIGRAKLAADAAADYARSAARLAPLADYLVLNVSSPNTPGLRELQAADRLSELVTAVRTALHSAARTPPLLVKLAPDLSDAELDAVVDRALELELDGLVAVNTTTDATVLGDRMPPAPGGISGAPLRPRALEVLRRIHARAGDRLTLVAVGGIATPAHAWERILAGATLVQAYTGFIYGGPLWPWRMNRGLARRVRTAGLASIQDAAGSALAADDSLLATETVWQLPGSG
jgi:dihydroorotate dehydrogenase